MISITLKDRTKLILDEKNVILGNKKGDCYIKFLWEITDIKHEIDEDEYWRIAEQLFPSFTKG